VNTLRVYSQDVSAGDSISYTIDPHTLVSGMDDTVFAVFGAVVDKSRVPGSPGSLNLAAFSLSTRLTISTVGANAGPPGPEGPPGPPAGPQGAQGPAGLGLSFRTVEISDDAVLSPGPASVSSIDLVGK